MAQSIDDVTSALENARVSLKGLSFAGKSFKLNTADDAKEIVKAIEEAKELQYLNLEGNTLGVDAAQVIAQALEKHPEFQRALWKDMFTGRMKAEIPKALEFLGNGLVTAGARLTELDLSDNAFGPIGVEGLAFLLRSSSCYALQELRLNNNGLGITGGKLLAAALTDCFNSSKKLGKPLALKVFIAGRNRLENEGAKALAKVFKLIGTLEEVAMPQNGIYHVGISALSKAFTHNQNLEILNLNDNTITHKGAAALAEALPALQKLKTINVGDCLLKTKGAQFLAQALTTAHPNLEELVMDNNEINKAGGLSICQAVANKGKLKKLVLDCNQFGDDGLKEIFNQLKSIGKYDKASIEDNDDEEEDQDEGEDSIEEGQDDTISEEEEEEQEEADPAIEVLEQSFLKTSTVEEFQQSPSVENFLGLGDNRIDLLLKSIKKTNNNIDLDSFLPLLMKVSGLSLNQRVFDLSFKCVEELYRKLFTWAKDSDNLAIVNNALLVHVGLLKAEDKSFKPSWNLEACLFALSKVLTKNYVPDSTKNAFKLFIERQLKEDEEVK